MRIDPCRQEATVAYQPPEKAFQIDAHLAIKLCEQKLWERQGSKAVAYLKQRGLLETTMKHFHLGYSPGIQIGQLYIPQGIVIPCIVSGEVWYLKICLLPGQIVKCEGCGGRVPARQPCITCGKKNKYRGVRGNRTAAIFNGDWLRGSPYALVGEGEIDAMIAHQMLNDVLPCVTFGSAGNRLDLASWGRFLDPLDHLLVVMDNDPAGDAGVAIIKSLSNKVHQVALPEGVKDINEFYLSGGDLWRWLQPALDRVDPSPPTIVKYASQLGATVSEPNCEWQEMADYGRH